ncbi:HD domain-containing protein [Ornithinibacillus scapharcae]|uniref:HD domain-containing protein n=1 Tax=Ornithinibacillus scapharcae TaxID=1147159 RepID=UPI000225B59F|nr:HD domain-containing protein [Ornithinibacillus scapharcae]
MYSNEKKQLKEISAYCHELFSKDSSGHDYYHLKRVAKLAGKFALQEKANYFISVAGAWLHDVGDVKLFEHPDQAISDMKVFLTSIDIPNNQIDEILTSIDVISYSKGKIPQSIEGKIIQDADRIDAIGAIGIARTFAYGGAKGQLMYHDEYKSGTSVQHFYDKILKLKDTLHTESAKKLAEERHRFVESFLDQFLEEWGDEW